MAVVLNGADIVSTDPAGPWSMPLQWGLGRGNADHPLISFFRHQNYDYMYRHQPSVRKVVSKLSGLGTMVPLKVYQSGDGGRVDARESPYGQLITKPSTKMPPKVFWRWVQSTHHLHGEAFAAKVRDPLGRPVELLPIHPLRMRYGKEQGRAWKVADPRRLTAEERDTGKFWWYLIEPGVEFQIARRDLVVWPEYNPSSTHRGCSKLETLRSTLEDDASARAAMEAIWKHGGKPAFVLTAPDNFKLGHPAIVESIAKDFQAAHGGVAKWQKPLVLDGGMDVKELRTDKNLEYLGLRKLTDAEVAAVYDINPIAVHQLDRATFNNVEELLRDLYRSTMPPVLSGLEDVLEFELRDGRFDVATEPDFGSSFYAEHLLDGVMRGSFEARAQAYASAIQNGWLMVAEVRDMENRPFIEGTDVPLINTAVQPLVQQDLDDSPRQLAEMVQKLYLGTPEKAVLSAEEARAVLNRAGAGLAGSPDLAPIAVQSSASNALTPDSTAAVMGRLSRPQTLAEIDVERLVDGLAGGEVEAVLAAYEGALDVPELRAAIKEMRIE